MPTPRTWLTGWVVPILLLLCVHAELLAEGLSPSEQQLKVAYIYNFTKFVTWPAHTFADDRPLFRLCILGEDPFGGVLDTLSKKTVQGKELAIHQLDHLDQISDCHALFISPAEGRNLPEIWRAVQGKPILTIGDMPGFVHSGGMINFIRVKDTLRFEIHQETVLQSGLKISAAMLQVGIVVK